MNQRPKRNQIKAEPKDKELSKPRNSNALGHNAKLLGESDIDPSKITPEQLKRVTGTRTIPKIISNVIVPNAKGSSSQPVQDEDTIVVQNQNILTTQNTQSPQFDAKIVEDCGNFSGIEIPQKLDPVLEHKLLASPNDPKSAADEQNNNSSTSLDVDMVDINNPESQKDLFDYTPTSLIDELEVKDTSAEFIGYVDFIDNVKAIPEHGNLLRMVVNNTKGLRVMITCWNNYIPAMMEVAEIGVVLEISGLLVKENSHMKNNLGSTKKFFEAQAITTYNILGRLEEIPVDAGICKVDFGTIAHAQGIICIEGFVKHAPRLQTSDIVGDKIVGGITDGVRVIEINLPEEHKVDHILKGECIKVIGAVIKKSNGLHVIKVSAATDIISIPVERVMDLEFFLNAKTQI